MTGTARLRTCDAATGHWVASSTSSGRASPHASGPGRPRSRRCCARSSTSNSRARRRAASTAASSTCFRDAGRAARALLALEDSALRAAGLSRSKVLSVRDLATKAAARKIPSRRALDDMDDEAIIERLIEIRGVGRWTVEMLLIFTLDRPDVLPVTDLGIRRGFMICRGAGELPEPAELLAHGEIWRPYRSIASWYLWRASEL